MDKEKSFHHLIDIPESFDLDSDPCFIHRVPIMLRKVNESAYTPQLLSIGPYNHGLEDLKPMELRKEKYRGELLKRTKKSESDLKEFVHEWSEKILESYEEGTVNKAIEGALEDFEEIVAKDSCFVLEILWRNSDDVARKKDLILKTPWLRKAVKLDLILLENQLPFFFLEALFEFLQKNPNPNNKTKTLLHITSFFFEEHFLTESNRASFDEIEEIKHFTDLVRQFWLPIDIMGDERNTQKCVSGNKYLYCATKLDSAGVTFEPMRKEKSLTDVKIFKKPVLKFVPAINCMILKLPELKIQCETECLIRNIMALEICLYPNDDYICGYVALMDQLINTKEDVDFLVDRKILTNLLGSNDEAAKLFNGLCCQIPRDKSYYARFHNELNAFYENSWNVTRATLKKVYFKDLWTGSSTVVGLFVLLFTVSATTRNVMR